MEQLIQTLNGHIVCLVFVWGVLVGIVSTALVAIPWTREAEHRKAADAYCGRWVIVNGKREFVYEHRYKAIPMKEK